VDRIQIKLRKKVRRRWYWRRYSKNSTKKRTCKEWNQCSWSL